MERIQKVVPWPIIDISTVGRKIYFVAPGFTFTYNQEKDGSPHYIASYSGTSVQYTGENNVNVLISTTKKFVESEKARRELSSPVTAQLLSTIDRLEKELEKTKEKYKALKYAPGGEKFREAEISFEQLKNRE